MQKFVRRVEIGPDCIKIYWNVDKEFYSNEVIIGSNMEKSQANACDSLKDQNNLKNVGYVGSNSFTNGASGETRTRTPFRAADFESATSTIPSPRHR